MKKKSILDFTKEELSKTIKPSFRAKQVYGWIYQKYVDNFDEMLNLPKDLRKELKEKYDLSPLKIIAKEQSIDGSIKYLFSLKNSLSMEAVLLPMKEEIKDDEGNVVQSSKYTICISSQVGCKIGCAFCLTAKEGFKQNLTAGEIVAQVLLIKKDNKLPANKRVNIVFMGMGEPLDNFDNVVKAIKIFSDPDGLCISPRRQTVSTSGLSHQIKRLGDMNTGVLLAISLHAVDDEMREKLMPINKAYNIASILDAIRNFPIDARKRVMFEYLVIKELNDDIKSAKKLIKLLHGIKAKVNLIYFNPYPDSPFKRPDEKDMRKFQSYLRNHGITCTIRESKGLDISAACGQLYEKNNKRGVEK